MSMCFLFWGLESMPMPFNKSRGGHCAPDPTECQPLGRSWRRGWQGFMWTKLAGRVGTIMGDNGNSPLQSKLMGDMVEIRDGELIMKLGSVNRRVQSLHLIGQDAHRSCLGMGNRWWHDTHITCLCHLTAMALLHLKQKPDEDR